MTTNQPPVQRCQYCGSDDLGLGWQHGEAMVTFKKHGHPGQPAALPDLPPLRRCAVSNGWRSPTGSHPSGRPRKYCDRKSKIKLWR